MCCKLCGTLQTPLEVAFRPATDTLQVYFAYPKTRCGYPKRRCGFSPQTRCSLPLGLSRCEYLQNTLEKPATGVLLGLLLVPFRPDAGISDCRLPPDPLRTLLNRAASALRNSCGCFQNSPRVFDLTHGVLRNGVGKVVAPGTGGGDKIMLHHDSLYFSGELLLRKNCPDGNSTLFNAPPADSSLQIRFVEMIFSKNFQTIKRQVNFSFLTKNEKLNEKEIIQISTTNTNTWDTIFHRTFFPIYFLPSSLARVLAFPPIGTTNYKCFPRLPPENCSGSR